MNSPVWAEIDLAAYGHNIRELKSLAASATHFMAVVKANGYGHGAAKVARVAIESGADYLGVARLGEALELRESGIDTPILIFGHSSPEEVSTLLGESLRPTVFSYSMAEALAAQAVAEAGSLRVHIKVDTGMGRLGILASKTPRERRLQEILDIAQLPGLEIEGLFTHLATADSSDSSYAKTQLRRFRELVEDLDDTGLEIPLKHAANSAALVHLAESHFDMVRPGIATYGLQPSSEWQQSELNLRPALQWKARIIQLKDVPAGFGVSYGITYKTPEPTTLATVAVGYADGLNRLLSSRGEMLVSGYRVPIVGRICMDLTLLDVGGVPEVSVGDEAVILGRQGNEQLSAEEMARALNTINYEIVTSISSRVPRIYTS